MLVPHGTFLSLLIPLTLCIAPPTALHSTLHSTLKKYKVFSVIQNITKKLQSPTIMHTKAIHNKTH